MIDWRLIAILVLMVPILSLGCALVVHALYGLLFHSGVWRASD